MILTVPISVYEVAMHTEYYTRPRLQRHVIRILWMVPIYSADAWLALRFKVRGRWGGGWGCWVCVLCVLGGGCRRQGCGPVARGARRSREGDARPSDTSRLLSPTHANTPQSTNDQDARLYLDPVRECYEAYVIYSFYAYLMSFLEVGGDCLGEEEGGLTVGGGGGMTLSWLAAGSRRRQRRSAS